VIDNTHNPTCRFAVFFGKQEHGAAILEEPVLPGIVKRPFVSINWWYPALVGGMDFIGKMYVYTQVRACTDFSDQNRHIFFEKDND